MKNDYATLLRFLRVRESVPQELLAKKIGTTKSNISRLENKRQNLVIDDLEKCLNYLGYYIKIVNKNGEDMMKVINNKLNGLELSEMGYLGHYDGLNQDNIRVEFNLLDLNILINKDLDTIKYVSNERFEEIMSNLTDEEGYGDDWDCYLETSVEILGDVKDGKLVLSDNIYNIFSKEVVKQIVDMFNELLDNRLR